MVTYISYEQQKLICFIQPRLLLLLNIKCKEKKIVQIKTCQRLELYFFLLLMNSYAPGLGQSSVRTNADMDYVELMNQSDLPGMDENLNLDQFGNFGNLSELMQAYNAKQQ